MQAMKAKEFESALSETIITAFNLGVSKRR